ncbi:XylR family transcriptional regulator [Roseateles sp.]|uniref:XylR family transcriptional regulator n=1 Tax=Roseateles sp. TaxID=1971397 RepID=UPI003BA43408
MKMPATHKIALLFNANKIYDREVISGIASYLKSTRAAWDLFMEEDFRCRLNGIDTWVGDGIIADFDDPQICEALADIKIPVVAVGGSYEDVRKYPAGVPYVATDNEALIRMAFDHLIEGGLRNFALFSLPESGENRWAQERESAFCQLMQKDRLWAEIYRGHATAAPTWVDAEQNLIQWVQRLPKPIGIIAVTDARARQLLQACSIAGIPVPEQVAVLGIDNDPLTRVLTRIPLSSVIQGAVEIGRTAAQLLHQMLSGGRVRDSRVLVAPVGINVQASSSHQSLSHPSVMRGMHFIRQYACQGIKTEQVADYVGVSRSSLDAHFRRELGHSVHTEILKYKLKAATKILANENTQIADVAVSCGFTTVQYLNAVFRRELDCTPREYRDKASVSRESSQFGALAA